MVTPFIYWSGKIGSDWGGEVGGYWTRKITIPNLSVGCYNNGAFFACFFEFGVFCTVLCTPQPSDRNWTV